MAQFDIWVKSLSPPVSDLGKDSFRIHRMQFQSCSDELFYFYFFFPVTALIGHLARWACCKTDFPPRPTEIALRHSTLRLYPVNYFKGFSEESQQTATITLYSGTWVKEKKNKLCRPTASDLSRLSHFRRRPDAALPLFSCSDAPLCHAPTSVVM